MKLVPPSPIADLRSAVEDELHAGEGRGAGRRIGQIAAHDFDAQRVQEVGPAPRANQCPDMIAQGGETFGQMTSQQTRSPR